MISPNGWVPHKTAQGYDTVNLVAMVSDSRSYSKCVIFGEKFRPLFVAGRTLSVKNFVYRDHVLRILNQTQVARRTALEVSPMVAEAAILAFDLPASPLKSIPAVKQSPVKSKVTVKGKIKHDQAPATIQTKSGQEIMVRNMTITDGVSDLAVALWRDASKKALCVGQEVMVRDSNLGYSEKTKDHVVSVNYPEDIQIISAPAVTREKEVVITGGVETGNQLTVTDLEEEWYELPSNLVYEACEVVDFEEFMDRLPTTMVFTFCGETIAACRIQTEDNTHCCKVTDVLEPSNSQLSDAQPGSQTDALEPTDSEVFADMAFTAPETD